MALTRLDILTQASELIQDPLHALFNGGVTAKNTAINRVQRRILLFTELNKAHIIGSFATNTADGAIEYNTHTSNPTITYKDMKGWPVYTISDMYKMDENERWLTSGDGDTTKIYPCTIEDINRLNLLSSGGSAVTHYRLIKHNVFRFFPLLAASAYPWKVSIPYRKLATDMGADNAVTSMPEAFEDILIYAAAAEWCYMKERPDLAAPWDTHVRDAIGISIRDRDSMSNDKPTDIQETWSPRY